MSETRYITISQLKQIFDNTALDEHIKQIISYYLYSDEVPNVQELSISMKEYYLNCLNTNKDTNAYRFVLESNFLLIAKEILLEIYDYKEGGDFIIRDDFSEEFYKIGFLDVDKLSNYVIGLIVNDNLVGNEFEQKKLYILNFFPTIKYIVEENYSFHKPFLVNNRKEAVIYFAEKEKLSNEISELIIYIVLLYFNVNSFSKNDISKDTDILQRNNSKKVNDEEKLTILRDTLRDTLSKIDLLKGKNQVFADIYNQYSPSWYLEEDESYNLEEKKILLFLQRCNLNFVLKSKKKYVYFIIVDIVISYVGFMSKAYNIYHNERVPFQMKNIKYNHKVNFVNFYKNHRPILTMEFFDKVHFNQMKEYFFTNRKHLYGISKKNEKSFVLLIRHLFTFSNKSLKKIDFDINISPFPTKII